jgi:hypothetical protein
MRAAHSRMAKETSAEREENKKTVTAFKNFFKYWFGHCSFSLSRQHPVLA